MKQNKMICASILFGKEAETLAPATRSAPTFFTGQRIQGAVRVSHQEGQELVFDAVQLLLRGGVKNIVSLKGGISIKIEKPLIHMSCVKVEEDFYQISPGGSNFVTSQARFFFDIPESITLPSLFNGTERKRISQFLPPSVRVAKCPSSSVRSKTSAAGVCDVTYHIDARLLMKGQTIFGESREIIVMPACEAPPPLEPEDLKKEYTLFAAAALGSFWRRKKGIMVTSSSTEPRPFLLQSPDDKKVAPSTDLFLNFSSSRKLHVNDVEKLFKPTITHCDVKITLESTTYFLDQENRSVMSLAEAKGCPSTVLKTTKFSTQKRKVKLGEWNKAKDVTSADGRDVEWSAMTSVAALLPSDCPRLPSFFFSLVSRRYAFDVQIKLISDSGMCSHKPMKLRIPVQMVHAPLEKLFFAPQEFDIEHDLKAPAYVP